MFMLDIVWKVAHHVTAWKLWRSGMTRSGFPIRPPTQPGQRKLQAPSQAHTFANCRQSVPKARGWMPLTKELWTGGSAHFTLPAERVALLMDIYRGCSLPSQERAAKELLLLHILIKCCPGDSWTQHRSWQYMSYTFCACRCIKGREIAIFVTSTICFKYKPEITPVRKHWG